MPNIFYGIQPEKSEVRWIQKLFEKFESNFASRHRGRGLSFVSENKLVSCVQLHIISVIMVIEVHEPDFMTHNFINYDTIADMTAAKTS
jgi:hypothetical protein